MALHIDEIAIQLSVGGPDPRPRSSSRRRANDDDDDDDDSADGPRAPAGDSGCCDYQAMVADAVQQVLKILRDQEAR